MKYAYRCTSGLSSIQGITSSRNRRICSAVPSGLNSVIQIGRPCATFLVASICVLKDCTLATPYLRTPGFSRWNVMERLGRKDVPMDIHKINTTPITLAQKLCQPSQPRSIRRTRIRNSWRSEIHIAIGRSKGLEVLFPRCDGRGNVDTGTACVWSVYCACQFHFSRLSERGAMRKEGRRTCNCLAH